MEDKKYIVVETKEQLIELHQHIVNSDIIAYDTETTSLNPRTGTIIGFSVSGDIGIGYYLPTWIWNVETQKLDPIHYDGKLGDDIAKKLISLLLNKKVVMHNGSFDIRYTKNYYGIDLRDALYCDTMLLRHTLKEDGPFGLKDTAIELQAQLELNAEKEANEEQILMKENIKKNGGAITKENFEIYKADMHLLGRYAAADTDLTLRIMTYYLPILKEEGLWEFFFNDEVMPLYRTVTIQMEEFGSELDIAKIQRVKSEITADLKQLEGNIVDDIMTIPQAKEYVMVKALKHFPPAKKGNYAQKLIQMRGYDLPRTQRGVSLNAKIIATIPDEDVRDFLSTGSDIYLDNKFALQVSLELLKETDDGYININSKSQLADLCFNYLGIKPISQTRKGTDQFNDDLIEELAKEHGWAAKLRDYNKLTKINSAYIDRFLDGQENGRYYWYFKQHGTTSGRFSSDCQQMPRVLEPGEASELVLKYTNILRSFIKAEDGRKLIICDQSSLEPRVFASVSNDPSLINVFVDNEDLYSRVAIQAFKLRGMSAKKDDENYVKKVRPELRQRAKSIALAIPYGAGAWQIGQSLNIKPDQAQVLIDGYLEGFPELAKWMSDSELKAKTFGYVKSKTGRIRHLDKVKKIYERMEDNLLDHKEFFRLKKSMKNDQEMKKLQMIRMEYKNGLNNCKNFQIQSLAASIMNRSAIAIHKKFVEEGLDAQIMLQIHDEFVVNASDSCVERAAQITKECMETTVQIATGLVAEPNIADNFGEGHA
jgi:DNA polymerase I-like protein with 3'-5' exonuclease and polymerase domains